MTRKDWPRDIWAMQAQFVSQPQINNGALFIDCPDQRPLPVLGDGFLGIEFRPDTPPGVVDDIIRLLNQHVAHVTYSGTGRADWIDQPGRGTAAARRHERKGG
jgi:hypothetical protein